MDIKKIKELIKVLEDAELEELEVTAGGETIRIVKPKAYALSTAQLPPIANPASVEAAGTKKQEKEEKEEDGHSIKSPMVGTFYSRPSPEDEAFVKEGMRVQQGDVLCIVEAMKTMNKIKSDRSGHIKSILVEDGRAVEFGQDLFIIEE